MSIFWFALFLLITNVAYPLSPMFFINFIALLILNINSRKQEDIKRSFYISGFLVGIASLIETSATILLLFVLVMALIKEYTKFKELIITFLGMFTVYLYLFAIYFYMDNMRGFVQFFDPQNWICPYLQVLDYSILQFIFLLFIILLISYICIFFAIRLRNKTIQVRKKAGCFHIFTLTMFFVSGMNFYYLVEVMIISFSIYYAIFSRYTKGRIAYDIMLFLFVLILLFIKVWA
jgi:hypothetical protein